jgi:hypothetical protein
MNVTKTIVAGLLVTVAGAAGACELPKLVVIPSKEETVGKQDAIRQDYNTYGVAMQAYLGCVKAEYDAAGGDKAPQLIKAASSLRMKQGADELNAVKKLYETNVGAIAVSPGPSPAPAGSKSK